MKTLYRFNVEFGRHGELDGLFVAENSDVRKLIGQEIYFGEILGKHSEIFCSIEKSHLTEKSQDQKFIEKLCEVFEVGESGTVVGCNPFDYVEE